MNDYHPQFIGTVGNIGHRVFSIGDAGMTISSSDNSVESSKYEKVENIIPIEIGDSFPDFRSRLDGIPDKLFNYLIRNTATKSWFPQLILFSIMENYHNNINSTCNTLKSINSIFMFAQKKGYPINNSLDIGEVFYCMKNSQINISTKFRQYNSALFYTRKFIDETQKDRLAKIKDYLLPEFKSDISGLENICRLEVENSKRKRRIHTAQIKKKITNLVAISKARWEWMSKLLVLILELKPKIASGNITLPHEIIMPGFDGLGELKFVIWNKVSWLNEYQRYYTKRSIIYQKNNNEITSDLIFLQNIGDIPQDCWFLEAIKNGYLMCGSSDSTGEAASYSKERNLPKTVLFAGIRSGILLPTPKLGHFLHKASTTILENQKNKPILFEPLPLISATLIGYLSVLIFSLTGMRVSELLQLNLETSFKLENIPTYSRDNGEWCDGLLSVYIFDLITKGDKVKQKAYAPEIVIDAIRIFMKISKQIHGEKLKPIYCLSDPTDFALERYFSGKKLTYIFQWNGKHLSNKVINSCLYFILLGHTILDENGEPIRISSHIYRHGFAGYLRQKGVPLEKIASLLHQVNLLVTDYYSQEPEDVILEQMYSLINEIGGELKIQPGTIRSLDDIRRFERECIKQFGVLREIPGGRCGSYCSCEVTSMCARCEYFVPEPERRHEIINLIECCKKVASFYEKSNQLLMAEREKQNVRDWQVALAEVDSWAMIFDLDKRNRLEAGVIGESEINDFFRHEQSTIIKSLSSEDSTTNSTDN